MAIVLCLGENARWDQQSKKIYMSLKYINRIYIQSVLPGISPDADRLHL